MNKTNTEQTFRGFKTFIFCGVSTILNKIFENSGNLIKLILKNILTLFSLIVFKKF
jgi:hypothetical protein